MEDLKFTWEPIGLLLEHGLHDLGHQHWLEGSKEIPYDPDWEAYQAIENANMFRIISVRWKGHLIGYAGVRIFSSMQSRGTTCAYIQEYFISKKFRKKNMSGIKLFRFIEDQLKLMKVSRAILEQPYAVAVDSEGLNKFFDFFGYEARGTMRTKEIGV
jgi:hypothetical protein